MRDSTFALWGLYTLGFDREADDFFYFVADACRDGNDLQVMYGVGGERELDEESLPHLSGYEGALPGSDRQRRVLTSSSTTSGAPCSTRSTCMPAPASSCRSRCGRSSSARSSAAEHWEEPDRGIWEVRGEPQHFVSSKLMCWVALDRGARLARMHDEPEYAEKWQALADQIHADICANGVDERGVFVQRYGSDALDASLLLLPLMRFLPPDDPRIRATVLAIADELTVDGLVLRYRVEETDDGLAGEEGTLHDLLVLAGLGAGRDRRGRARHASCASGCWPTPARSSSTRRRSTRSAAGTWATSRRRSPTSP